MKFYLYKNVIFLLWKCGVTVSFIWQPTLLWLASLSNMFNLLIFCFPLYSSIIEFSALSIDYHTFTYYPLLRTSLLTTIADYKGGRYRTLTPTAIVYEVQIVKCKVYTSLRFWNPSMFLTFSIGKFCYKLFYDLL